jgi:uncharacterized membrane protein
MALSSTTLGQKKYCAHSFLHSYCYALDVYVLPGVWLLARCADLEGLGYSVNAFWGCLGVLLGLGAFWRICAAAAMLTLHHNKCR